MGRNGVKRQKQLRLYSCNGAKEALLFYTSIMSMSIIVNMEITVSDFHGMIIAAKKLLWTMLSVKFILTLFIVCCLSFVYWLSATPPVVSTLFFISCEAERVQSKIYNTHTHKKKSLSIIVHHHSLEVCGGGRICRHPAASRLHFLVFSLCCCRRRFTNTKCRYLTLWE